MKWIKKIIYIGGWTEPNSMRLRPRYTVMTQDGEKKRWLSPTPIRLLSCITFFGGGWAQIRFGKRGWLVFSYSKRGWWGYWSPNGTPSHPEAKMLWGKLND